ncbi:MAG: hypothetical protein AAGE05_00710 [Pseudomonadota bacterium]
MTETLADPERELALSYAKAAVRPYLQTLWMVDERFGTIVAGTTEAAIGEMRLLWWREAFAGIADDILAEPLLERVQECLTATGSDGSEWGKMTEGWFALLQEPLEDQELERFAMERGGRLFALSATLLTDAVPSFVGDCGRAWALTDLSCRVSDAAVGARAQAMAQGIFTDIGRKTWPRDLRPLGALTVLARRDSISNGRRQGAPARVARMLWHRLSGR